MAARTGATAPTPVTIIDALRDPHLFGGLPAFRDLTTWRTWLTFLKAVYGLPLTASDQATFRRHTGRRTYAPPPGGWPEVVCIVGRQSGKTRIAALIAAYEAAVRPAPDDRTDLYAVLVSQDQRAALRALFSYAKAPFDLVPLLGQAVAASTADLLRLTTHRVIAAYPCRPASVRGIRATVAVCDELAFFTSTESFPTDTEMLRALRPALATTGGKLIVLSSPYGQAGALWDLHRKHAGREDSAALIWQASAPDMNPTLPADYLARMQQDDPEAYRSEVLGEFRSGVATFLDPDTLDACLDRHVRERPPVAGVTYQAFVDPSGGRGDAFALAIAHRDGDHVVLDVVRRWNPPFNPSGVIAEIADGLQPYRIHTVTGDRYAGEFSAEAFRVHGIAYRASEKDRSALYVEFLPCVQAGSVRLLDHPDLLKELRGLERHRGSSGKDRIDHRPGAHDDLANAVAGVVSLFGRQSSFTAITGFYRQRTGAQPGPARAPASVEPEPTPPTCAGCGRDMPAAATYTEVQGRRYHDRCAGAFTGAWR